METFRPADLVARVVAWHNRHPLARRIASAHVTSVGALSLPMALRARDADGTRKAGTSLSPIFDTKWMYGTALAALDRFVVAHGAYPLEAAAHWPWRHVDADLSRARAADARGLEGRTARHVLTALIDADGQRSRVLVAPMSPLSGAAVFGRRLYSLPRVATGVGSAAAFASAALAAAVFGTTPSVSGDPVVAVVAAPAPAAQTAQGTVALASDATASAAAAIAPALAKGFGADSAGGAGGAEHVDGANAADGTPPEGTDPSAQAAATGSLADFRPADVQPMLQDRAVAGPLVRVRPTLTEDERRQARLQAEKLRAPPTSPLGELVQGQVYALATPPLRTRDDAQAQQVLLRGLMAQADTPVPTQLDVLPAGRRWRVVWWPHPQAKEAERLRMEASARGLKLEIIAF